MSREAADVFSPVYRKAAAETVRDLEVSPVLADDEEGTVAEAGSLQHWSRRKTS